MGGSKRRGFKVNLHYTLEEGARIGTRGYFSPPTDIFETREGLHIVLEIPGVEADKVSITVSGSRIVIAGEKVVRESREAGKFLRIERSYGKFQKNFEVIGAFNTQQAEAVLKDGLLKMFIPRCEEKRGKERSVRIKVDRTGEGDLE